MDQISKLFIITLFFVSVTAIIITKYITTSFDWRPFRCGEDVPTNAVKSGYDKEGSPIYIGRIFHDGELQTVTYYSKTKKAYISFIRNAIEVYDFQILINNLPQYSEIWTKTGKGQVPNNAVAVGYNWDHIPCYVARVRRDGEVLPAKYYATRHSECFFVNGNKEGKASDCEVLLYRTDAYNWVATTKDSIPEDYFVAGKDENGNKLGVGFTFHNDQKLLVKITPSKARASFSYGTIETEINKTFHVLINSVKERPFKWVKVTSPSTYPQRDVLQIGYTKEGQIMHVGRYQRNGAYYPGKVVKMTNLIYIPVDGKEEQYNTNFEVLTFPNDEYVPE